MSISSVTATPPLPPPPQPVQAKVPDVNQDDSSNSSPPVQAPLPPGQGIRVNIIA